MSTLIQLLGIHKSYDATPLLDGVSATFARGDRTGFVGANGAGKSTLLKILLGEETADGGEIRTSPELRLGYLQQHAPFEPGESVLGFLERQSGKPDWRCGKVAGRFHLKGELLAAPIASLPGGYQTRVKLASMLLAEPNFLILDEPTNYLDLKTQILLERFLDEFSGGYLLVSHDRAFLRRTCTQTLELERGTLTPFAGGIDAYLEWKTEERSLAERRNRNLDAKKKSLEEFVARYRVRAATASRAQSKMKQLEKLDAEEVPESLATAHIRLPEVEARKGIALRCEDLAIGYPERCIATDIRFEIDRGEHVAVLGDNGQGKTTFLRTIAGDLPPLGGSFQWGHALEHAYYAQHVYTALDGKIDVYTYLERAAAPGTLRQQVLDMAGSFLFRGDDVRKRVEVLSGGERARLCLAGLLLGKRSLLLLDEPTNHLDFDTVEALARALKAYRGTIFLVSHDRSFVAQVATSIVEVKDERVTLYPADYESYVDRTEREVDAELAECATEATPKGGGPKGGGPKGGGPRGVARPDKERRKELRAMIREVRRRAEAAERRVETLGAERAEIDAHYLAQPMDGSRARRERRQELDGLIADEEARWLAALEELEPLEREERS